MSNKKLNLFTYHDYRRYLADYFALHRRQGETLRSFALRAGLTSHSFVSAVINGKRDLTAPAADKFCIGLNLNANEAAFFTTLVQYCQAPESADKQRLFEQLNDLRRNTVFYKLHRAHYDYLSKWYHFVIRELAVCSDWQGDYRRLAAMVIPAISESEARSAVKLLVDLGLLVRQPDNTLRQSETVLTTLDVPGHLVRQARAQFIDLAARASEMVDPAQRNLGSTTLSLSREGFAQAVEIMEEARRKIIRISSNDSPAYRIYQAHLHLFPLSTELDSGGAPCA